jgi:preprotein translocase subunit YajC
MEQLIVVAVTFVLLWVFFILPQQRRVRAHQALVASIETGDRVVLSAGIYGRIVELGPEDLTLEVAPGVELRVARQAVLRLIEDATATGPTGPAAAEDAADRPSSADEAGAGAPADTTPESQADSGAAAPDVPDPDHRGPASPGPNV